MVDDEDLLALTCRRVSLAATTLAYAANAVRRAGDQAIAAEAVSVLDAAEHAREVWRELEQRCAE